MPIVKPKTFQHYYIIDAGRSTGRGSKFITVQSLRKNSKEPDFGDMETIFAPSSSVQICRRQLLSFLEGTLWRICSRLPFFGEWQAYLSFLSKPSFGGSVSQA